MANDSPAAVTGAQNAPETPVETVSPHQVAAMARILGLNPDNVVSIHADLHRVDVVAYDPPAGGSHPLLRELHYVVER